MPGRNPTVVLLAGPAHPALGSALAREFQEGAAARCSVARFPDGEAAVEVDGVRGRAVFVVQPLGAAAGESLLELVLIADACHRCGASSVSAVVPYLGYARQERRTREGQPLGARVVARLVSEGRFAHILAVDLHAPAVEGFFAAIVDHLSAVPLLVEALAARPHDGAVVIAPDLGAAKLARRYAARLQLPVAIVQKSRVSGSEVTVEGVVGDVRGRRPILVDDMISTGGTVAAAVRAVVAAGAIPDVTVVATHGLFAGPAAQRLEALPVSRLVVTDTLPLRPGLPLPIEVVTVAPLLADAIRRLADGRPLGDLLATS